MPGLELEEDCTLAKEYAFDEGKNILRVYEKRGFKETIITLESQYSEVITSIIESNIELYEHGNNWIRSLPTRNRSYLANFLEKTLRTVNECSNRPLSLEAIWRLCSSFKAGISIEMEREIKTLITIGDKDSTDLALRLSNYYYHSNLSTELAGYCIDTHNYELAKLFFAAAFRDNYLLAQEAIDRSTHWGEKILATIINSPSENLPSEYIPYVTEVATTLTQLQNAKADLLTLEDYRDLLTRGPSRTRNDVEESKASDEAYSARYR